MSLIYNINSPEKLSQHFTPLKYLTELQTYVKYYKLLCYEDINLAQTLCSDHKEVMDTII